MNYRMCVLGECMLEVSAATLEQKSEVSAGLSFGGDTLNVATYYARLGGAVDYLTALGDDGLSTWLVDRWTEEGVGCHQIVQEPGGVPGLYLIQVDDAGERSFIYWRDNSPAKRLLSSATALTQLLSHANGYDMFYLSGITLSLMTESSREMFFSFVSDFRAGGGLIAFDGNYRPSQWPDKPQARLIYEHMYRNVDIALSTAGDECLLFEDQKVNNAAKRLQTWGVQEIVIKDGNNDCLLVVGGNATSMPALQANVIDTTAAGDSFNAAYLASRAKGIDCRDSVNDGHRLAAIVIGHRGAIIPRSAMFATGDLNDGNTITA
jgi:2-dehydro-3-deoxygluconokinase